MVIRYQFCKDRDKAINTSYMIKFCISNFRVPNKCVDQF